MFLISQVASDQDGSAAVIWSTGAKDSSFNDVTAIESNVIWIATHLERERRVTVEPITRGNYRQIWIDLDYRPDLCESLVEAACKREMGFVFEMRDAKTKALEWTVVSLSNLEINEIRSNSSSITSLQRLLDSFTVDRDLNLPPLPFEGGVFTLINYEESFHVIGAVPETSNPDETWGRLLNCLSFVTVDHTRHRAVAIELMSTSMRLDAGQIRNRLRHQVATLLKSAVLPSETPRDSQEGETIDDEPKDEGRSAYECMVKTAQARMPDLGVDEVVLSTELTLRGIDRVLLGPLFLELRQHNPSPYMCFVSLPDIALVANTPLGLVEIVDGRLRAETDAGTRSIEIGSAWQIDDITKKEEDEHRFALQALEEDVRQIAEPNSVSWTAAQEPRRFGNVVHLFGELEARLRKDVSAVDAFGTLFPHGAVTGWPKSNAVRLISELEGGARGPYGGAFGLFGFDGSAHVATLIRIAWIDKPGDAVARFGASLTAESDPTLEFQECMDKANQLLTAAFTVAQM